MVLVGIILWSTLVAYFNNIAVAIIVTVLAVLGWEVVRSHL